MHYCPTSSINICPLFKGKSCKRIVKIKTWKVFVPFDTRPSLAMAILYQHKMVVVCQGCNPAQYTAKIQVNCPVSLIKTTQKYFLKRRSAEENSRVLSKRSCAGLQSGNSCGRGISQGYHSRDSIRLENTPGRQAGSSSSLYGQLLTRFLTWPQRSSQWHK